MAKNKYFSLDEIAEDTQPTYYSLDDIDGDPIKPPSFLENVKDVGTALVEGAEQTYRMGRAAVGTYLGADKDVIEQARKNAESQRTSDAESLKALKQDIQSRKEANDDGILQGIKNVAGAIADNPAGGVQLVAEQAPNAAVALGAAAAGAKGGALIGSAIMPGVGTAGGAVIGGIAGFLSGLFGANTLLETGGKAIEKAGDGSFTPQERSEAISEGLTKGAVITGVDVATLGTSKFILGTASRAVEEATIRTLTDSGIDATKAATNIRAAQQAAIDTAAGADRKAIAEAVEKATAEAMAKEGLLDPAIAAAVQAAQKTAFETATTLPQRLGRGAGVVGLESLGEGVGEGLGEYAATGKFSPTEAALESIAGLSQSLPEIYVAKRLNQPGLLTEAMSPRRQLQAQEILSSAPDASTAAAAADELAGSLDALTAEVDQYLASRPLVSQNQEQTPAPKLTPQQAADREARLLAQANQAQTEFDRRMALEQIQSLRPEPQPGAASGFVDLTPMDQMQAQQRLVVMRDEAARTGGNALGLTVVPHPAQPDRFAIAEQALPSLELPSNQTPLSTQEAQLRIESAALAGQEQQRRAEDGPRQQMISRAMAAIESRGGVASPMEAEILRQANMGQPFDRIDSSLTPSTVPAQTTPRETVQTGAIERANTEMATEQQARNQANQAQAQTQLNQQIEQTNQPAALPNASEVIGALATPGAQRTAEQTALIRQAESRFDPVDFSIMQRAATSPFQLSADERVRLKDLRNPAVTSDITDVTNSGTAVPDMGLTGTRVLERLGQPSSGRIITSDAKLSTQRGVAPGATLNIKDGDTAHEARVVDIGRLGNNGRLINQIGRIFGKRVVAFESGSLQADGFVLPDDGQSIYLNVNSQISPLAVFGHEMTHLLKRDNAEAYSALEAVVQRQLGDGGMDRFTQEYGEGANIEELTSDLVGNRFQESDFWQGVFDEIAAQNPDNARSIIIRTAAAITKAINAFMRLVRQPNFQADQYVKDANEIKKAVRTALAAYAQSQKASAMQMEAELAKADPQVDLAKGSRVEPAPTPDAQTFEERQRRGAQTARAEMGETEATAPTEPGASREQRQREAARAARQQMGETITASRQRPDEFKATRQDKAMAEKYEDRTGEMPYLSEGQIDVPLQSEGAKFSVKRPYGEKEFAKGRANDPLTGLPLNKNGTVTLYFPTDNATARELARTKKLKASSPTSNRIYLTNESSGPKVMNEPGNIEQSLDGANVLIQVDPALLHLDQEFENGRKDFFIPIAEGKAFQSKMTKLFTLDAPRTKALTKDTKLTDLERRISDSISEYLQMDGAARRERLKEARQVLKDEHNVGTLLGVNGKLEKTNTGGYGLNNYNGKDVMSMGLGLASAQKINEKNLSTCPNSAICEGLCLGETSGQNLLYGGEGQFKSGPRLAQYLKTEAMVVHPEDFAIVLHAEIEKFQRAAAKEEYQPTVRLNVTSDFRPQTFEGIIDAFPGVMFYDYTKLPTNSIAPNHHLTYSSTGASQVVDGETIINKESNWDKMVEDRLMKGMNVAMAFTSRNDMPAYVLDERTGERFQVWNGDNYDARFLDPKPGQEGNELNRGMIIGLTNKDKTTKPEEAAKVHNGFFLDYNPERDGDTLVIRNQKELAGGNRWTIPIAAARREVVSTDVSAADEVLSFSRRRKPDPEKTVTAYKLFRVDERKPGQLFPLFVNANEPVEMGVWLDADVGDKTADGKVKSKLGPLAFRPGWHAGDLPIATHIGSKSDSSITAPDTRPANHVWAEVEMAADRDWQEEANQRGMNAQGKLIAGRAHITDQVPEDGYYRYKTNPNMTGNWLIGGSMKVTRILSDTEVEQINADAGVADLPREEPFDPARFGFDAKLSRQRTSPFYSQLSRAIDQVPERLATQPAAQWKAWLASNAAKLGVKKEEIEWTGINDYLDLRGKDKVTKAEIGEYLKINGVQVEEVTLGGPNIKTLDDPEIADDVALVRAAGFNPDTNPEDPTMFGFVGDVDFDILTSDDIAALVTDEEFPQITKEVAAAADRIESHVRDQVNQPRYRNYVLSGGENYRELLLTLPNQGRGITEAEMDKISGDPNKQFISRHWDQPNVLAHIRFNERTDAEGKRVLFIEEMQSDWAQEGRKKGFAPQNAEAQLKASEERMRQRGEEIRRISDRMAQVQGGSQEWQRLSEERQRLQDEQSAETDWGNALYDARGSGVPTAPFVTDTKSWLALATKRMIAYAVDNGFDKVAFINGQQSANRYDLSKFIDEVVYSKNSDGTYNVSANDTRRDETRWSDGKATPQIIEETLGKDLTEKIVKGGNKGKLTGIDLKVGGEGMVKFYDQIVPQVVNEVLKKVGGGKLGTTTLQTKDSVRGTQKFTYSVLTNLETSGKSSTTVVDEITGEQVAGPFASNEEARNWLYANDPMLKTEQLAFTITDGMKAKVAEGLPLFSRRRNIFQQPAPLARWTSPTDTKLDDFIYKIQDKMVDTRRVVEAVRSAVGNIDDKWNPYLQEELYHGRTAKATKDFLNDELRPLLQEMQMRKIEVAEFEEYLHNRHAEERNIQIAKVNQNMPDGGSGIDTQKARDYLSNLDPGKRRQFEALARRIDAMTASTRQLLIDSGLETQDTINAWEGAYKSYVPLQREDLDFSSQFTGMGTGQGYQVKGPASKRATGSSRPVVDILANLAMQRERAIVRAQKTRVAQAVYGMAVQNPNTDFWLAVDPAGEKDPAKAIQNLISMGINPIDAQNIIEEPKQTFIDPRTGLVTQRVNPLLRNSENVLAVRINGEEKYVFFNANDERSQRMVSALKNLDADQLGRVMSMTATVTRYFASVNTQYNPIFGVINFVRDSQGALLQLSTTPIADRKKEVMSNVIPALRGIYADVRAQRKGQQQPAGVWAGLWEEFQEVGGQTGYRDQFSRSAERAEALERELKRMSEGKVKQAGRVVFDWLADYNETMENAVRLAAYKAAKDKGLSKEQAASIAKNLTVNFNRKGQVATQAGALYAFFNAAVQGTTRLGQTLKGPAGKKIMAGGLLLGVVQAMALAAADFDEDEPPDFVKERNLIIPLPNGKYIAVPMPLGYNVIPNTSRVLTEFVMSGFRDPGKRVGQITGAFMEMFNPIGNAGWSVQTLTPTVLDPLVALSENRDWTGKPIAKKDMDSRNSTPGYTRAKETASWFSKELAYYLNLASFGTKYKQGLISPTPDQLDYLIGQATGGVGRELLKAEQTITSQFTGEELPPYKIPLVGRFYGDSKSAASESNRFYENITRLNEHENEIKGRRENREPIGDYFKDNPEARLFQMANNTERQVSELRKRRRELVEKGASKESVKLIEQRIAARMKQFNDRVKALREQEAAD